MAKYINLIEKTGNNTYTEIYVKQNLPREFTFTVVPNAWTGSGPYTATVTVKGITADTTGIIGVSQTANDSHWEEANRAKLRITGQGNNSITLTAYGIKPTLTIPFVITCTSNMKMLRDSGAQSDTVVGG